MAERIIPTIQIENIITKNHQPKVVSFHQGLVLLIDKPKEWTSFDVVNKLRFSIKHKLGVKKIKVGHAGTLDPMATGLLILCVGKYTKTIETMSGMDKSYTATIKLGATTPSFDAESDEDAQYPTEHITEELLAQKLELFRGPIEQLPPMFSAIKIKGQKLYNLARKGKTVERKKRQLTIHKFEITEARLPDAVDVFIECSKGTYIRALADDYGRSLDSGGYLTALRRESIADYQVMDALSIEECVAWIEASEPIMPE